MRIGGLLPERCDYWWSVDADTDLESRATDVAKMIERLSLPFFSKFQCNEALLENLRNGNCPGITAPQAAVLHMLMASSLGHMEEAALACKEALSLSKVPAFSERVLNYASKLGIRVQ